MLHSAIASNAHALIVSGDEGVGLATIAQKMVKDSKASYHLVLPEKDEKIDLDKGVITVKAVRRLYDITKTVEPKGRYIIIDYAERMGVPAQNAFLKLLEEPPKGTRFILLTHKLDSLLPTIRSRSQLIQIKPVSSEQSEELLNELKVTDPTKRTQLLFIASGLPAELTRLSQDMQRFSKRASIVKDAREYAAGPSYKRLLIAYKYKADRTAALTLLEDTSKMLQKSLENGTHEALPLLSRVQVLHQRISEQGNIRLQLSALV